MDDVELHLRAAFLALLPRLHDPLELAKRLTRRNTSKLLRCHPRPWCLALRASDTRLLKLCGSSRLSTPDSALSHCAHSISLTKSDLQHLCLPVHLDPPGESLKDVASKLGTTITNLLYGLYLVGWFRCDSWQKEWRKLASPSWTLEEARKFFKQQANAASNGTVVIESYVLDAGLRSA